MAWFSVLSVGIAAMLLRTPLPPLVLTGPGLKALGGYALGWLVALAFAAAAGHYAVQLLRHRPVFRVGVLGIQLGNDPLDPWHRIRDEKVVVTDGKQRKVSLSYFTPASTRRLDVSDCGITAARLRELLVYYRQQALHEISPAP